MLLCCVEDPDIFLLRGAIVQTCEKSQKWRLGLNSSCFSCSSQTLTDFYIFISAERVCVHLAKHLPHFYKNTGFEKNIHVEFENSTISETNFHISDSTFDMASEVQIRF